MGASYGSLLAIKLVAAGHDVKLACTPAGAAAFNANGARVRMPLRGGAESFEIDSRTLPGRLSAAKPDDVRPEGYDLVVLAMQEPQYRLPGVRELLQAVAVSRVPCMSIMNMPPPPFLRRIPGVPVDAMRSCYADFDAWRAFEPGKMTLCSPDPQAFRPPGEPPNVLQVRLATNFKAARFASDADTALLRELEAGIEAARFDTPEGRIELPVKLKVHDSLFVPIAKWSMLLAATTGASAPTGCGPYATRCTATSTRRVPCTNGCRGCRWTAARRPRTWCRSTSTRTPPARSGARRRSRARSPGARPRSNASIVSCRRSERRGASAPKRWTRSSRTSIAGSRRTCASPRSRQCERSGPRRLNPADGEIAGSSPYGRPDRGSPAGPGTAGGGRTRLRSLPAGSASVERAGKCRELRGRSRHHRID